MDEALVGQIQQQYKEGLAYKRQMGFLTNWPEYERFKAGDQWPKITEKTKSLPRPVFNIIDFIENHKVSSVMNENVKMLFTSNELISEDSTPDESQPMQPNPMEDQAQSLAKMVDEAADKFTRFADTTWDRIKQDELNEEALETASNIGTAIWHYYWDNSVQGGMFLPYIGDMCGEVIDPMDIFFGNPQQRNVQKQPYIIIRYRDTVASVKEIAKQNKVQKEMIDLITSDKDTIDQGYDQARIEVTDSDKTTVLLKYWKENGQVFFAKACHSVMIQDKTPTMMKLYPIAVLQWKRRKKSIFGVGDTEGIIPNQKAINFLLAMQILSVQLTGWPKLKYNPNYVSRAQAENNVPGAVIEDRSPQGERGVEYMIPGAMSPAAANLVETIMDYTKQLSSAQDAATGDMQKGQLNATAIMLLQKAAGVPIESIKKRFYRAMEDIGRIWEEFWKTKYNTNRMVTMQDDNGNPYSTEFNGSQYQDIDLALKIDIGPSSSYSEELMMSSLDKLFDGQYISLQDYLEFAPKNVVPFKDRLLKKIQDQQAQQAAAPDVNGMLANLSPQEQQAFHNAPPELQQQMMQQLQPAQPQAPQGAPMAPQQPPQVPQPPRPPIGGMR